MTKPNILYIFTDQQSAGMMSCAGYSHVNTPAMDSLAKTGTRFTRAYCTNPVCMPSRTSMFSGRMPSHFGIVANLDAPKARVSESDLNCTMGRLFKQAGYDTAYAGKIHLPDAMQPDTMGFTLLTNNMRDGCAAACIEFLKQKRRQPFLLVASFINPHDICLLPLDRYASATGKPLPRPNDVRVRQVLRETAKLPPGVSEDDFFNKICPPLVSNHAIMQDEPGYFQYDNRAEKIQYFRTQWGDKDWRFYHYIYARLTERVDHKIGLILDTLRSLGLEEDTVVIFSSDHGDMNGSHKMTAKNTFYEEAAAVPFIVSHKNVTKAGTVDTHHAVSAGLDLIPTMCDFAGIRIPEQLPGRSVRNFSLAEGVHDWREAVLVESKIGKMVCSRQYKYAIHPQGTPREMFIDLQKDPDELVNRINDSAYQEEIEKHRVILHNWLEKCSVSASYH